MADNWERLNGADVVGGDPVAPWRDRVAELERHIADLTIAHRWAKDAAKELAKAGRQLVNAGLPEDLDTERPFWVAARNMRATLSVHKDLTGVDGEQDVPKGEQAK